jgi:ABC-2 type transport system ATP-binding protein
VNTRECLGLTGPSSAGKTTTLRILATLLQISSGSIKVFGHDLATEADEVRKIISYLPEDAGAYKNLTGRDYLEFIAAFFGESAEQKHMVEKGLKIARLDDRIDDKVDSYSKGMARRLLVARALMIDPKVAILDELTSGLDVLNAQEVRKTVKATVKEGTTIILSSHNMLEVELMCDRIALINDGLIVEMGTPTELKKKYDVPNIEEVFVRAVQ